MRRNDKMGMLIRNEAVLQRKYFDEMVKLVRT